MTTTLPPPPTTPPPPPAPVEPARDLSFGTPAALIALVLAAVLVDLAFNTALAGWAVFAAVAVTVIALMATERMRSAQAIVIAAGAFVPAVFLGLRASPWLLTVDVLAIVGLLALGAARALGGDLFDTRFTTLFRQVCRLLLAVLIAPVVLVQSVVGLRAGATAADGEDVERHYGALLRGLALTLPIVLVIGAVLASGDAVFASFLRVDLPLENLGPHLFGFVAGTWLVAAVLTQATLAKPEEPPVRRPLIGPLEGSMVLGGLIIVYALFATARLLVALRGDSYVLETTGLTYAEYARSGFFQLLGAAALTVLVLLLLRTAVDLPTTASRRVFAFLAAAAVVLTLVMVQSAVIRLGLYDAAFGLTLLRLYSTIFAWWIGAVLVLVGLALCGVGARRSWLPGAVACSALITLVLVNVVDPERMIMNRNLDRLHETGRFDTYHATGLSDDGLVVLVDRFDELGIQHRTEVRAELCGRSRPDPRATTNLSVRAGTDAWARLCRG
jgi:hypothetical protein